MKDEPSFYSGAEKQGQSDGGEGRREERRGEKRGAFSHCSRIMAVNSQLVLPHIPLRQFPNIRETLNPVPWELWDQQTTMSLLHNLTAF